MGGRGYLKISERSNVATFTRSIDSSIYPLSFHTLAHSFALLKISTLFFSMASALFDKNTLGWGYPLNAARLVFEGTAQTYATGSIRKPYSSPLGDTLKMRYPAAFSARIACFVFSIPMCGQRW